MNPLTLYLEITGGDSITFDGEARLLGVTLWRTTLKTPTEPPNDYGAQMMILEEAFAAHLADVLNRPRPYCACPHLGTA